jgi:DNA-binding transcriptional LysR family regulator
MLHARQIEAFRAVMLTGSMTGAADLLRVSQPAISRLVRDLEDSLGFRLFERHGNHLVPMHEAALLYREVDRFFVSLDRIGQAAEDIRATKTGTLRLAAMTGFSVGLANRVIAAFLANRPGVSVSVHAENSRNVVQLVAMHHYDLGLVQVMGEHPGVETLPLPEVHALCVMPVGHPLGQQDVVKATDLAGVPIISLARNSPLRMRFDAVLLAAGVHAERRIETSLAAGVCELVAHGLGVAVIDPFTIPHVRSDRIVARRFEPTIPYETAAIFPLHRQRARVVDEFAKLAAEIIRTEFAGPTPRGCIT